MCGLCLDSPDEVLDLEQPSVMRTRRHVRAVIRTVQDLRQEPRDTGGARAAKNLLKDESMYEGVKSAIHGWEYFDMFSFVPCTLHTVRWATI
jgi:hypothetical protein